MAFLISSPLSVLGFQVTTILGRISNVNDLYLIIYLLLPCVSLFFLGRNRYLDRYLVRIIHFLCHFQYHSYLKQFNSEWRKQMSLYILEIIHFSSHFKCTYGHAQSLGNALNTCTDVSCQPFIFDDFIYIWSWTSYIDFWVN